MRMAICTALLLVGLVVGHPAFGGEVSAASAPTASQAAKADELVKVAGALADLHRFDESIGALTLALAQDPKNGVALALRAIAYGWTNRIPEASVDLAAAEKLLPDSAILHRVRAIIANRRSDQETELRELTKSLQFEPGNPFALNFRANIYLERRQFEAAMVDAEAYIRADPDEPDAFLLKAYVLADQQRWTDVRKQLAILTGRFAREPRALAAAAKVYLTTGDRAHAMETANSAIRLDDSFYYVWRVRAKIRAKSDTAGRRLDLMSAIALAPGDLGLETDLGLLDFDNHAWAAALQHFNKVIAVDKRDFGVLAYRALTHLKLGDSVKAQADYETAKSFVSGPDDFQLICWVFAHEGMQLDWALDVCNHAVAANPQKLSYRTTRGLTHLQRKEDDLALEDYDRAIAINPGSGEAAFGRAIALWRKGRRDEALRERDRALMLSPLIDEAFTNSGLLDLHKTP